MKPLEWLRAHKEGAIKHDWAPIVIERGGHRLELMVSADAAIVDGIRANIGARGQQLLADALGAMLPTAVILAERHRQANVRLKPHTMNIDTATAAEHSGEIDKDLANDPPAVAGAWLVSDVGKCWVIDRLSSPTVAIAEGDFLDGDRPQGIFGPAEAPGVLAVRVPSERTAAHPLIRAGKHNLIQGDGDPRKATDYSQKALFVQRACVLNGVSSDLGAIYSHPVLCAIVSPDAKPLPARHPGVELLEASPEWRELAGGAVGGADGAGAAPGPCPSATAAAPAPSPLVAAFIQARNYLAVKRTKIDWIVLHSTENAVAAGVARNIARWFQGSSAPMASAHYIVGPDEIVQGVHEELIAYAAPGANERGIQIEQVGQIGRQPRTDWLGDGRPVIERSARLVAAVCRRWGIPLERVDAAGLLAGRRGITTHASVTEAFKRSTHQDPGLAGDKLWPWDEYLALVRAAATLTALIVALCSFSGLGAT